MFLLIKKHPNLVILSVLLLAFSFFSGDFIFVLVLAYILFIKLLLSKYVEGRIKKNLTILIWSLIVVLFCLGVYVNNYMPHGPNYSTGEIACQNDGRGPCGETYIEDTRNLNIPEWAKLFRGNGMALFLMGLAFAGIVISYKKKEGEED